MRRALIGFAVAVAAVVGSCTMPAQKPALAPTAFSALEGWDDDSAAAALVAWRRSCARLGDRDLRVADRVVEGWAWRRACTAAAAVIDGDDAAARRYFERWFTPYTLVAGAGQGLLTGYYEPLLRGARKRDARYTVPIYGLPSDLVVADLGRFDQALSGRRLVGRVEGSAFVPYPDRAAIEEGALADRAPVLAWADDPVDVFFLQVQGSGRIRLDDGSLLRVGYAGKNGHPYVSIGRLLIARGAIAREDVSLQSIRAWLAAHPDEAAAVLAANPSFVFFRRLEGDGPIGAQGVALTPGRSLAVDRRFIALGTPVWVAGSLPDGAGGTRPLRRLVVAQDVGGAIKGPLRGDLFLGFGPAAEEVAGRLKHPVAFTVLLPRTATVVATD